MPSELLNKFMNRYLQAGLLLLVVAAIIIPFFLSYQAKMIFPGANQEPASGAVDGTEKLRFVASGHVLEGWVYRQPESSSDIVLLYFGGNAENVGDLFPIMKGLDVAEVVAYNYRGYGNSEGKAGQKALFADALAIFDLVAIQALMSEQRVVVMGRSLGSAVAGHVAVNRDPAGLILVTPLSSVRKIAASQMPWLPMEHVLLHPLDLNVLADRIQAPVLAVVALDDQVIPNDHSLETYRGIKSDKRLVEVSGFGHGDIFHSDAVVSEINLFLGAE